MHEAKEINRIAAFSDGVFAIACTLLVLELAVPHLDDITRPGALWPELKKLWPSFLAYFLSFVSIFIAWAGHHRALNLMERSSKPFLYANGLLLLTITFMPFPTALLAEYIDTPQANIAVVFYSSAWLITNLSFIVWWACMFRPTRLLSPAISRDGISLVNRQMFAGTVLYLLTTILAYWYPVVAFVLIFVTQILWVVVSFGQDQFETVSKHAS